MKIWGVKVLKSLRSDDRCSDVV